MGRHRSVISFLLAITQLSVNETREGASQDLGFLLQFSPANFNSPAEIFRFLIEEVTQFG